MIQGYRRTWGGGYDISTGEGKGTCSSAHLELLHPASLAGEEDTVGHIARIPRPMVEDNNVSRGRGSRIAEGDSNSRRYVHAYIHTSSVHNHQVSCNGTYIRFTATIRYIQCALLRSLVTWLGHILFPSGGEEEEVCRWWRKHAPATRFADSFTLRIDSSASLVCVEAWNRQDHRMDEIKIMVKKSMEGASNSPRVAQKARRVRADVKSSDVPDVDGTHDVAMPHPDPRRQVIVCQRCRKKKIKVSFSSHPLS